MDAQDLARNLLEQEPGRGKRHATAARAQTITRGPARHHESADEYSGTVACLSASHRVIICKDRTQWILQRRDGERAGGARWAGVGYCRTREALLRLCRASSEPVDPAALSLLAALPEHFTGVPHG